MAQVPASASINWEERTRVLEQQLAQAQRLTALGELSSTITHEFNNILTTTINYAKLGLRQKDEASRDKAFTKILSASERAARLTSSILRVSRQRGEQKEPTALVEVIEDVLVLLERELQKYRVTIVKDLQPCPPALANAGQIQQVLMNLLINARQALSAGGTVCVGLKPDADPSLIELSVRDNGKGIPPEVLPRIFDPFFSTKTRPDSSGQGGTGLGLTLCARIIEAHQGRIRVESTVGKGTAFLIKLPVAKVTTPQSPTDPNAPWSVLAPPSSVTSG